MNKNTKPAGFFAKIDGGLHWKERIAKLRGKKAKTPAKAKLEIDDAAGEKMIFPNIGDVSEIDEQTEVTATDGPHVFTADGSTYTIEVLGGKVTSVVEDQTDTADDGEALNEETQAFVEAVAEGLLENSTAVTAAQGEIETLKTELATAVAEIAKMKGLMKHGGDGTQEGDDGKGEKPLVVGGKTIDIKKLNFKK